MLGDEADRSRCEERFTDGAIAYEHFMPQGIHQSGHDPGGTTGRRGDDDAAGGIFLRRGEGIGIDPGQELIRRGLHPGSLLPQHTGLALHLERPGELPFAVQPAPDAAFHMIDDLVQGIDDARARRPGDRHLVVEDDLVNVEALLLHNGAQFGHIRIAVNRLAKGGRFPALPLDEAAAHGVILLRMQHVVFGVQQIRHQRVAVRKIMDDRVMAYVVDANRHLAVAERTFTARMRIIHKLLKQSGGTTFRGRAEQTRDDGGIGPVARTRGAEGTVQAHPEAHGAHQQITRQRGAGFREMVPCLHGADGVGTGRSGPHFVQVEQRGIDASLRHGDLLNPGLRALVLEAFAARNGRPETRPEKPLIFSDQKKLKTRRVVLEP